MGVVERLVRDGLPVRVIENNDHDVEIRLPEGTPQGEILARMGAGPPLPVAREIVRPPSPPAPSTPESPRNADCEEDEVNEEVEDRTVAAGEDPLSHLWSCQHCGKSPCDWATIHPDIIQYAHQLQTDDEGMLNSARRFRLYRKATFLIHGHLGRGERRELPKCVVDEIHAWYPGEQYTGFRES